LESNSEEPPSQEELAKKMEELKKESKEKTKQYYDELIEKLKEYGSVELLAQMMLLEIRAQSPSFHNPANPMSENPFGLFLSGLFLNHHNFDATPVQPNIQYEITDILSKYFDSFRLELLSEGISEHTSSPLSFLSKQEKFMFDANPRCFNYQKINQIKSTFMKIDDFLLSNFGFTTNDALRFTDMIVNSLEKLIFEKQKLGKEKFDQAKIDYNKPQNSELRKTLEEKGISSAEEAAFYYAIIVFLQEHHKFLQSTYMNFVH